LGGGKILGWGLGFWEKKGKAKKHQKMGISNGQARKKKNGIKKKRKKVFVAND